MEGLNDFKDVITKVYDNYVGATSALHTAGTELTDAQNILDVQKALKLASGEITGKNAELREASARELLGDLYAKTEKLESVFNSVKLTHTICSIEVERVRLLVRIMELEAKVENEND